MTHEQLSELFRAWWKDSFPSAPPNSRTVEIHVAFADYVLNSKECFDEYVVWRENDI